MVDPEEKERYRLFNEYAALSLRLKSLGGIVQNSLEHVTEADTAAWVEHAQGLRAELKTLLTDTLALLKSKGER